MSWSRIALAVRSDSGPVPRPPERVQPDSGHTKVFVFIQMAVWEPSLGGLRLHNVKVRRRSVEFPRSIQFGRDFVESV